MKESERENFPLLARAPSGKYVIFRREEPKNVEIIRSITGLDIDQINRDLREWRGVADHYSYFRVLSRTGSACEVVLEVPATKDWVIRGTYVLQDGKITAQRLLAYLVRALRS